MSLLDKAIILPADADDLAYYLPFVVSFIKSALEHTDNEISLGSILSDIENHKRQLWIIKHRENYIAAVITQIYTYDDSSLKIGEITIAGGRDHHLWDHFTDVVGNWFREQGCKFIDIIGRPGWERLYRKRGFKLAYVQLRKKL